MCVPMSHVALAWVQAHPAMTSLIIGARTVEQLEETASSVELTLSADEVERLTAASDAL